MGAPAQGEERRRTLTGVLYALAAFGTWGFVAPVHFKLIASVPPFEVLAQRIVWATLFVLAIILARGRLGELTSALAAPQVLRALVVSALLVGVNWFVYIWAISTEHIVQASLGCFINPLVNVALGILFLGERLRPLQLAACAIAAVGVAVLTVAAGDCPGSRSPSGSASASTASSGSR
jgi:chloramphenicol-sensitive protein RarD